MKAWRHQRGVISVASKSGSVSSAAAWRKISGNGGVSAEKYSAAGVIKAAATSAPCSVAARNIVISSMAANQRRHQAASASPY